MLIGPVDLIDSISLSGVASWNARPKVNAPGHRSTGHHPHKVQSQRQHAAEHRFFLWCCNFDMVKIKVPAGRMKIWGSFTSKSLLLVTATCFFETPESLQLPVVVVIVAESGRHGSCVWLQLCVSRLHMSPRVSLTGRLCEENEKKKIRQSVLACMTNETTFFPSRTKGSKRGRDGGTAGT